MAKKVEKEANAASAKGGAGTPASERMRGKGSEEVEIDQTEFSEKELLKQAEEREKERKGIEEAEKEAQKEQEKKERAKGKKQQSAFKTQKRVKPRHGKKYREIAKQIEIDKEYPLTEAIELALKTNPAKFDATVELHVRLHEKEKNIRGMVTLPGGVVKEKKILEVTENNLEDTIANVKSGKTDFDIMIADLKVMPKLAELAKILGPKGLMPSPKAGTAVEDVKKAAEELRGGKVEYRADKQNIIHMVIGKISFGAEKISQNYQAILGHLPKRIESIYITTSMGPSIKVAKK